MPKNLVYGVMAGLALAVAVLAAAGLGIWNSMDRVHRSNTVAHQTVMRASQASSEAAPAAAFAGEVDLVRHEDEIALSPHFSPQQVCRATIATLMGRDPAIIVVVQTEAGIVHVTYIRPNDGTRWSQKCMFEESRVVWAAETGRWRIHPADEVFTFSSNANTLTIRRAFADGSVSSKTFTREQLTN